MSRTHREGAIAQLQRQVSEFSPAPELLGIPFGCVWWTFLTEHREESILLWGPELRLFPHHQVMTPVKGELAQAPGSAPATRALIIVPFQPSLQAVCPYVSKAALEVILGLR